MTNVFIIYLKRPKEDKRYVTVHSLLGSESKSGRKQIIKIKTAREGNEVMKFVNHVVYQQIHKEMMIRTRSWVRHLSKTKRKIRKMMMRNFPSLLSLTVRTCYLEQIIMTKRKNQFFYKSCSVH